MRYALPVVALALVVGCESPDPVSVAEEAPRLAVASDHFSCIGDPILCDPAGNLAVPTNLTVTPRTDILGFDVSWVNNEPTAGLFILYFRPVGTQWRLDRAVSGNVDITSFTAMNLALPGEAWVR